MRATVPLSAAAVYGPGGRHRLGRVRIEHVAVWTRDLERLRGFYERYLGGRAGERYVNDAKGFSSYFLEFDDGARLELMSMASIADTLDDPLAQAMAAAISDGMIAYDGPVNR